MLDCGPTDAVRTRQPPSTETSKPCRSDRHFLDPSDLGTLAGLNAFARDYLRGKADEVRQDAESWGLQI